MDGKKQGVIILVATVLGLALSALSTKYVPGAYEALCQKPAVSPK